MNRQKIIQIFMIYKALNKGELLERLMRFFIKKFKLAEKFYVAPNIPKELELNWYNLPITNSKILKEHNFQNNFTFESLKFSKVTLLGKEYVLGKSIDWFLGKNNNKHWLYEDISYYKDVKDVWELNRLQFLTQLSILYIITDNNDYFTLVINLLNDWIEKNPPEIGINWVSSLEVAIRSISILLSYFLLGNKLDKNKIKNILYIHGYHIYKNIKYTEKCIPNNHIIGEASALYILSHFLKFDGVEKWKIKSKELLCEYLKFFRNDGTYLEGSLSYHRFVLQMYILIYYFSKVYNDNFIDNRLENIFINSYKFFKSIEKPDGTYPFFGDWDDGVFYKLDFEEVTNFKSFVDILGYIVGDVEQLTSQSIVLENLFKDIHINLSFSKSIISNEKIKIFMNGKFGVLRDGSNHALINNQDQILHSHSDGLSVELVMDRKNITVDSGTYSYNLDKSLRKYLRSSQAHNTVFIGSDQSNQISNFRWINPPKNMLEKITLDHTLYGFIGSTINRDNRKHFRCLLYSDIFKEFYIIDKVLNVESNYIELNWHFAPELNVKVVDSMLFNISDEIKLKISSNNSLDYQMKDSYYSPSYGKLIKRSNIKCQIDGKDAIIVSIFYKDENPQIEFINNSVIKLRDNIIDINKLSLKFKEMA